MSLSKQEKNNYIQQVILKGFCLLQSLPFGSMLVHPDGTIIAVNDICQRDFGQVEMIGSNFADMYKKSNLGWLDNKRIEITHGLDLTCKKLLAIHNYVVKHKTLVNFILVMPHNSKFILYLLNYIPVFHENGELVAVQQIATEASFFGVAQYLNVLQGGNVSLLRIAAVNQQFPVELSPLQHEIIFLLTIGISQYAVAQILNISRDSIKRIISAQIFPKFDITGNSDLLIKKAKKMGFHKFIPSSLCKVSVFILDPDIADLIGCTQ